MSGGPESKSSFYWGFLFLSKPQRDALGKVYGFCRGMDDIVDSGHLKTGEAQKLLDFWREEVVRIYADRPTHSLSRQLLPHVHRYRLPQEAFLGVISGVEMDLRKNRYRTFEELEPYLKGVAVAVGLLCIEIFGYKHTPVEQAREFARHMGYAFQLTNIIRDVGEDLETGRVYLPVQEIEAAGYSLEALLRREHNEAFVSLMRRQYERAAGYYRRARNHVHHLDRVSLMPAEMMARVYEEVLERIRLSDFRVFFARPSVPVWRKAQIAVSTWAYCHGIF